jgi:O-antigen ligase
MATGLSKLGRLNPGALATLVVIFAGLAIEGADEPARAALFSGALLVLLLGAVIFASGETLARVVAAHWISGLAAVVFVIWTLATTAPLISEDLMRQFGHPLADAFGWYPPSLSIAPHSTLEGLPYVFAFMAAFALGALTSSERESRDWTGRWLTVLTILFSLFALNLYFTAQAGEGGRLNAHILSANAAAALFGALALFASALIVRAGMGRLGGASALLPHRLSWAAGFVRAPISSMALIFAIACAVLTVSRGGLFATAIGFLVFLALLAVRRFSNPGFLFAPVLGIIGVAAWLFMRGSGPVVDRLEDTAAAAEERRLLLEPHLEAFLARPLFGNGLNTYHEINTMAATPENWGALSYAGAAHNIYVQALEEVGLIGAGLMVLMLAPPILRALRRALFEGSGVEWAAAVFGVATLLLLHGAVDFELHIPAIAALFAFALGAFSGATIKPND